MCKNTENQPIGGYFELETPDGEEHHSKAIPLNCGRAALEYVLRAKSYTKAYLPVYCCDAMLEPVRKLGIEVVYYPIDAGFNPQIDYESVTESEVIIYINYFGICNRQVHTVIDSGKNILVDNAQSFFSSPYPGVDTFYSARKFFGVPDGAYLYTDQKLVAELEQEETRDRCAHLLLRIENGVKSGYEIYQKNEGLFKDTPVRKMSQLSRKILRGLDYDEINRKRIKNFHYLHDRLGESNKLPVDFQDISAPLAYPYMANNDNLRNILIRHNVLVPMFWSEVLNRASPDSTEHQFAEKLLPLPIDQRYHPKDLKKIADLIFQYG